MEETPVCHNENCPEHNWKAAGGTNCLGADEFPPQHCAQFQKYPAVPVVHDNQQQKPSRAQELVDAHWGHYVGPLLAACGVAADLLPMLEFMYKSSGVHFYKHCAEDQQEVARKAMNREPAGAATCINYSHEDGTCAVLGKEFDCHNCQSFHRKA